MLQPSESIIIPQLLYICLRYDNTGTLKSHTFLDLIHRIFFVFEFSVFASLFRSRIILGAPSKIQRAPYYDFYLIAFDYLKSFCHIFLHL